MKKALLFLALASTTCFSQSIELVYDFPSNFSGSNIIAINNKILFQGKSSQNGNELWVSDGTTNGTMLLKDNFTGSANGNPDFFIPALGKVFFQTYDSDKYEFVLYTTDGTSEGTKPLRSLSEGPMPFDVFLGSRNGKEMGDKFYFCAKTMAEGTELFVTDGTAQGTSLFKDIRPGAESASPNEIAKLGNKLFFSANDGVAGAELWVTDGTSQGTMLVKDINPGTEGSSITNITAYNGKIYFQANDQVHAEELWQSDGTPEGTIMLKDIYTGGKNFGSSPNNFIVYKDLLYFAATDSKNMELWVTDGTTGGTKMVKDINPGGIVGSFPSGMLVHNDRLYFSAEIFNVTGRELMYLSPTLDDVLLLKDLNGKTSSSRINEMQSLGSTLIISADSSGFGAEQVWISDGTSAGTRSIKYSGSVNTSPTITGFTVLNNEAFFYSNYKGGSGTDLYKLTGVPTSVEQSTLASQIVLYPNPVQDMIRVQSDVQFKAYKISSLQGKIIAESNLSGNEIYVGELLSGSYILELVAINGQKVIKKVIK